MYLLYTQHSNGEEYSIDTPVNCLYCLMMAVWSTILMELWKRRQNEIAHIWGVRSYKSNENIRPEFKADLSIDSGTKKVRLINTAHTQSRRIFGEIPIASISVSAVIACAVGSYVYQQVHTDTESTVGASIINSLIIIVLEYIYKILAKIMADWENHKYSQ